jgi:hypothetical protein
MEMLKFLAIYAVLVLTASHEALAVDLRGVPWNESSIEALRTPDKSSVEALVNELRNGDPQHAYVGEFAWVDLASDDQYHLVATEDLSGRAHFYYLAIYTRSDAGDIAVQWIEGDEITDLSKVIRDLDGDGKDELIVPSYLHPQGPQVNPLQPTVRWPKVYSLRDGRYVDASTEFPKFYDEEVLPKLENEIERARQKVATNPNPAIPSPGDPYFAQREAEARYPQRLLEALEMSRDQILQVLGRKAGHER